MADEEVVAVTVDGDGIATFLLNRPERRNAINAEVVAACVAGLDRAREDDVRVVVLTGAGSAFCAGGDVNVFGDDWSAAQQKRFLFEGVFTLSQALQTFDKPVIAMLNGPAMGAGLDLALLCDLRFAAADARLGESYIRVGVAPGDGGAWLLPRLIGTSRALDLLWTGREVMGEEALALGVVDRVFAPDQLAKETYAFAKALADGPLEAIRMTKRAVYQAGQMDLRTHVDMISSHMAILRESPDFAEGVAALRERRAPRFNRRTDGSA
jgi:2-(1,2-epoxy-1,2-dihydrophenyl)acetyl-CoA isomerase